MGYYISHLEDEIAGIGRRAGYDCDDEAMAEICARLVAMLAAGYREGQEQRRIEERAEHDCR